MPNVADVSLLLLWIINSLQTGTERKELSERKKKLSWCVKTFSVVISKSNKCSLTFDVLMMTQGNYSINIWWPWKKCYILRLALVHSRVIRFNIECNLFTPSMWNQPLCLLSTCSTNRGIKGRRVFVSRPCESVCLSSLTSDIITVNPCDAAVSLWNDPPIPMYVLTTCSRCPTCIVKHPFPKF